MKRLRPYFRNKRLSWLLVVLVVVASLGLAQTSIAADAVGVGNALGNSIFLILSNVVMIMIRMFATLTGVLASILVMVARYNTFLNAPIVEQGWPIVRDLMNMVFIIGLLMISAGTVLRLQNYRYNQLLGKLILMAFLVNFSKFIAVFLLQFAQIVMLTFVNAFRDVAFGNFSHMFGLDAVLNFANEKLFTNTGALTGSVSILITLIAGLIMMVVAFVVMLAITVVLFVRIVALWLLIILSPLAYALRVIPQTDKYASQWWSEFTKYAVVGPVLAFFLWIALALVGNGNCAGTDANVKCTNPLSSDPKVSAAQQQAETDTATLRADLLSEALTLDRMITFIVGIIFLMMGLSYAQKSGGAGGAWAGKVATAGFGVASSITGLNAIRDRTIAPVQGWLQNRQKSRQSAVQQRTETLEAFGDRARAALPVAQVRVPGIGAMVGATAAGKQKAAAAAASYERNRTARRNQELGMKDWTPDALHSTLLDTSGNVQERDRIAAMTELQGRGLLNLADSGQRVAFNMLTRPGTSYIPQSDRKKFREDVIKTNAQHLNADRVREIMQGAVTPEEQLILTQSLEGKKALDANDARDRDVVNNLRNNLRDLPVRLKEFDDALKRSNPEMAMRTIYNGLGERAMANPNRAAALAEVENDIDRFYTDVQQGLMTTKGLSPELLAQVSNRLNTLGTSEEYAQNRMARGLVHSSRTKEDMDRNLAQMNEETLTSLLDGAQLDYRDAAGRVHSLDDDKRKSLADKHFYSEAFTRMRPDGTTELDESSLRQYARLNGQKIKDGYKTGRVSNSTVANEQVMNILDSLDEIDDDDAKALTKDVRKRQFYGRMKMDQVAMLKRNGANLNQADAEGRRNLKHLRMLVSSARGGNILVDPQDEDSGTSSLEWAYSQDGIGPTAMRTNAEILDQLRNGLTQYVRSNGDKLTNMWFDGLRPEFKQQVVDNINVRDLSSLHNNNTTSVIKIIQAIRQQYADAGLAGRAATNDTERRLKNIIENRLPRNDILSGY